MGLKPNAAFRQSGVIPYRISGGRIEILLINTRTGGHWTIPKGHIKRGLSAAQSAVEEAYEEAGVYGRLLKPRVGYYEYRKWGGRYRVKVFLYEVTDLAERWPEDTFRTRRWATLTRAAGIVKFLELCRILDKAGQRIASLYPHLLDV